MRLMEAVTRYRCRWCGKEFRTPDRHICKYDPDFRNCLSCKFRGAFVEGKPERHVGFGKLEDGVPSGFMCEKDPCGREPGQGWWNDIPDACSMKLSRSCPDYETADRFKGGGEKGENG